MFTNTNGGVQKAFDPASAATKGRVAPPTTVSTGRSAPITEQERLKQTSLQSILGRTGEAGKTGLLNRLGGIQDDTSQLSQDITSKGAGLLGNFNPNLQGKQLLDMVFAGLPRNMAGGTLSHNLGKDAEFANAAAYKAALQNQAKEQAAGVISGLANPLEQRLSNISPEIGQVGEDFKSLGLLERGALENLEGTTNKERAGISKALSRLRDVNLEPAINEAGQETRQLISGLEEQEGLTGDVLGRLRGLEGQFGQGDITNTISRITPDISNMQQLLTSIVNNGGSLIPANPLNTTPAGSPGAPVNTAELTALRKQFDDILGGYGFDNYFNKPSPF